MFHQLLDSASHREKTETPATVAVSFLAHGVVVGSLLLLSLLSHQVLREPPVLTRLAFLRPEPPPPPPARQFQPWLQRGLTEVRLPDFVPPPEIQSSFKERTEVPLLEAVRPLLTADGLAAPTRWKISRLLDSSPVPEAPPPPVPVERPIVRVGGNVQASKLIFRMEPSYPALARQARVAGTVVLQVTVDEAGNVGAVRLISGHPLLTQAAVDAVRQWRYSPTLLNGDPTSVIATVTIQFVLK
jgi:protein TonB